MSTPEATASPGRCSECGDFATHPLEDNCPTQIDWAGMRDDLGLPSTQPAAVLGREPESPLTYAELILIGVALGSHAESLRSASLGNIDALERRAAQYEAIYDRVAHMAAAALDHANSAAVRAELYPIVR